MLMDASLVTIDDLKQGEAAVDMQRWFEAKLPGGGIFADVVEMLCRDGHRRWLYWLAADCPSGTWAERMRVAEFSPNPEYGIGVVAAHSPVGTFEERADAARRSDAPGYWMIRVACMSPTPTWEERMQIVAESKTPAYHYGVVAVMSPVGTMEQRREAALKSENPEVTLQVLETGEIKEANASIRCQFSSGRY